MNAIALVALVAGGVTTAALITWARFRALRDHNRRLEMALAAWQYRARLYGGALAAITAMHCPPSTLADARKRAAQALRHLEAA